jgi:hypothetical protein
MTILEDIHVLCICVFVRFKVELKQDEVSKICFQRVEGGASISGVTCTKKGNSFIVTLD